MYRLTDPMHTHGDCPAVTEVGFIQPGQVKQTGVLSVARTCGFTITCRKTIPICTVGSSFQ